MRMIGLKTDNLRETPDSIELRSSDETCQIYEGDPMIGHLATAKMCKIYLYLFKKPLWSIVPSNMRSSPY